MNTSEEKIKKFFDAIAPQTEEEKIEFDAQKMHLDFMFLLEDLMKRYNISRRELAQRLGVAPSYVTQLFNATRLVNLKTIAKLQRIFDVKFKIVPAREVPFRYKKQLQRYRIDNTKLGQTTMIAA